MFRSRALSRIRVFSETAVVSPELEEFDRTHLAAKSVRKCLDSSDISEKTVRKPRRTEPQGVCFQRHVRNLIIIMTETYTFRLAP